MIKKISKFDYLLENHLLKEEELNSALEYARKFKESPEAVLMRDYKISRIDLARAYETFYNCRCVLFDRKMPVPVNLLRNLKREFLSRERWVPIGILGEKIHVIMDDPLNILKHDTIQSVLKNRNIHYDVALEEDILRFIDHFFCGKGLEPALTDFPGWTDPDEESDEPEEIQETDSVIVQMVNKIINGAFQARASDIHIEPDPVEKEIAVRYRIDGDCVLVQSVAYKYRSAIVSRIKIISNLDITERRLPQDGKIRFRRPDGSVVELRVATIPTQGRVEDVVMRILARGEIRPLEALDLSGKNHDDLVAIAERPYGLILVVGPTGSGKTTTLHGVLKHINKPNRKIWTAEDPVEITQRGLRQVQVNPKIGFDFAASMRSFLRADPDVIMVGEMRDFETAKIGIEASLTGHLVFSTLHTNNAPETIMRLLDIGIDSFNFADSLLGVLAQRLVRTLCRHCREAYRPTDEEWDQIARLYGRDAFRGLEIDIGSAELFRPIGCKECGGIGYKGRMGIHELLINTDEIKRLIQKGEPVDVIRAAAGEQGMTTLLQDGIIKVIQGRTDLKQVLRTCIK